MCYAYNEVDVLMKKAGLSDNNRIEAYADVYHSNPDALPAAEQIWSVGTIVKDGYKEKEKLEKVGLKVVKLPKAKVVRVTIPCRSVFTYFMNVARLY